MKYTIIYSEVIRRASMHSTCVKFDRVETDNIAELIQNDKYQGNVDFVFEGWPRQEDEDEKKLINKD